MNLSRNFKELVDKRLVDRGNKIYQDLFSKSIYSIRQICESESEAKGAYRFLKNKRVSEDDIVRNHQLNCVSSCRGKYVVCIQDTTEVNLSKHRQRIKRDEFIGTTNSKSETGLGFLIHPSLVLDAYTGIPYGYSAIKIWNRPLELVNKYERQYQNLPIEEKESYKWIEVSKQTQETLTDVVQGMLIIQDREGDIYQQFASIPDAKTDLLIRARSNRTLVDKTKLFSCLDNKKVAGEYEIEVASCLKTKRKKRTATLEVRFKEVEIKNSDKTCKLEEQTTKLYLIEAKEINYTGKDAICWRLLTTIEVTDFNVAYNCIEWYTWRWTIEEVFKILKKEGFNIEASELESASSIRKLSLMILEVVIKLFLMRIAYQEPELAIEASSCFNEAEIECLEHQITKLEGKTQKQKNPYQKQKLNRYVWCIARMGGWKGYAKQRNPGITTLWLGLKKFDSLMEGWELHKNVSTR
jgi:hypothetical protein